MAANCFGNTEKTLIEFITLLIDENIYYKDLCWKAYCFRTQPAARNLAQRAIHGSSSVWKHLCHYIGRLGSWYKAARFLSRKASIFVDILENCTVEVVPSEIPSVADPPTPMWELSRLLSQAMPDGFDMSIDRLEDIFGTSAIAAATADALRYQNRDLRLKTHAEAAMAHFFFSSGRRFIMEDRYIGCSKASCSCCALYLELHPGNFERRPCHGNTWIQWRFPGLSNPPDPESVKLMRRMADRMQGDVKRGVISGLRGHAFTLDSSTNMSSVLDAISLESKRERTAMAA